MLAEELVELHRQGNRPSIDVYVRSHGAGGPAILSLHISPVSATASQVLPWLRYVSVCDPQCVKNTPAVASLTCLATKGLKTPRDKTDEICGLARRFSLRQALCTGKGLGNHGIR
jgi:hypothetical protein